LTNKVFVIDARDWDVNKKGLNSANVNAPEEVSVTRLLYIGLSLLISIH
jgi:hypothetical protein